MEVHYVKRQLVGIANLDCVKWWDFLQDTYHVFVSGAIQVLCNVFFLEI